MRIAYVITRADAVGGASVHVRDLSAAMQQRGHKVRVFVGGSGPVTEQLDVPWERIDNLQKSIDPLRDWRAFRNLQSALKRFRPDLVSAHTAKAGWLARAAACRLDVPVIYTPHGWSVTDRISKVQGLLYTVAERIAAPWTSAIVCVSESERRIALEKRVAPPHQLHVIYNGVRDVPEHLRAKPANDPACIVCVARFEPPKDHATLLRALSQLKDLEWTLQLIGDGPLEPQIRSQADQLGIAARVQFAGCVRDPAVELSQAQIFALASRFEGFPRSILEAMRAGLPVVASDVGGVSEAVRQDHTGLLAPAGDAAAMAAALAHLIKSPSERQRMGRSGHLIFQEHYTLNRMIDNTFQLYATLVEVPHGHTA